MKRPAAIVATLALLSAAIYFGRDGGARRGNTPSSPTGCLELMFRAAEEGDVPAYLDCFTGPQRELLAKEVGAQPAGDFAAELKTAVRTLKGRAVSGAGPSDAAADTASLAVERIYAHHTERQSYHFRREADGWRIDSVGAVEKQQPPIPYGTPVFDLTTGQD